MVLACLSLEKETISLLVYGEQTSAIGVDVIVQCYFCSMITYIMAAGI